MTPFLVAGRPPAPLAVICALLLPGACSAGQATPGDPQTSRAQAVSAAVPAGKGHAANPRFLYVIYCNGTVDRLDLAQPAKVSSFALSERSGTPPAVAAAPSPGVKPDSCLARPATTDGAGGAAERQVQLVATPQFYRSDADGQKAYRLLTFSLPDWTLRQQADLGMFDVLNGTPPRMVRGPQAGQWVPRPSEGAPDATAELAGYASGQGLAFARFTQWSGDVSLVEFAGPGPSQGTPQAQAGFADRAAHRFVRLAGPPDADSGPLRLAPGGRFAVREVQRPQAPAPSAQGAADTAPLRNTGELRVYRTADGQQVASVADARIGGAWHGIAITPSGWAVYTDRRGAYRFVALGRAFGTEPVQDEETDDLDGTRPGLVYSAQ
ncbi:hypothetical protein AVHY2522_20550 [Acidovorax sp. SUPP2522]|uniref:hypothetical protein n=1 Tax=unclassified Acidovorax TaxID=2684926 RepID=UPI00234B2DF5|nr:MULTISPECIES: hypothetical protein [unclassified Acidovorax]WCM99483.1 hypothetical protein M5C96_08765 [Acidovorax sp. GBBC 1281]GKT18904.1 hypothetical protein AVHY2522_20550 [Acidovorax sp. SUPP2522]